ncbi:NAD(P)-binding protein [Aaosphaeria arxii CBS 175.79]|uniref:NAD(P)-binding protein n=1 Tax=Aaosphaeria arxii CBS 175.79 TaxID=1450172 RepID=A0A6A5XI47_9PLEO|nr:NAD(P)-binding protein [Aaosphaeria arxii CBS 175.79]KAF2012792.1 NAD(P)-binding protein [Aaosphaeria arxii CBS 175.79]
MPDRVLDVVLADRFTPTSRTKPTHITDPANNKFTTPLNVCVIGATRGIGASIAHAYAQAGASTLILVGRSSSSRELLSVEKHAQELHPSIRTATYFCDLTSSKDVEELAKRVREDIGKLDILVLNSGISGPVVLKVEDGDPQDFQDVFNVNVQGTYLVAHYFIPILKESDGAKTFIVVGSFAACIIKGHIANTAYCLSKFAQSRLVEFIAEQSGKDGILAVSVHPGAVATDLANATTPDSFRPYLTDDVSLCGAFCVWLCQEKRMWLNGRLISATWDVSELLEKKKDIEEGDLLKWGYRTVNHIDN